ncbi:MAG: hypothetical protein WC462_04645 [archaeon]
MAFIYETKGFVVETVTNPHVMRTDGGHIKIYPKERVPDRQALSPSQATELMRLTVLVGEAMAIAMNKRGIDIGRINYQDNGNWSVSKPEGAYLHIHLYGRARGAKIQKYGQALYLPYRKEHPEFYEKNEPLNEDDIKEIQKEIKLLLKKEKYDSKSWELG